MLFPGLKPEAPLPSQPAELVTKGSAVLLGASDFPSPGGPLALMPVQLRLHSQVFPISPASCPLSLPLASFRYGSQEVGNHLLGSIATYFFFSSFFLMPPASPLLGIEPEMWACARSGTTLNQLSHASQLWSFVIVQASSGLPEEKKEESVVQC